MLMFHTTSGPKCRTAQWGTISRFIYKGQGMCNRGIQAHVAKVIVSGSRDPKTSTEQRASMKTSVSIKARITRFKY